MAFIALVAVIAFTVAGAAAYFSVYGLALIFSGAIVPVIVMASALEAGKLLATSILYNYWHKLGMLMRTYFVSAILILMLITSGGIYGFLSAAYQTNKIPLEQINQRIELLDAEFERKSNRLQQMDDIIASIGANYITKRLEEKEQQRPEREELTARLNEIETEKYEIKSQRIETEAHIGPVIYMAEVFGITPDQATNFLILLFIFVFDPLAVALTISVNMLIKERREGQAESEPDPQPEINDPLPPVTSGTPMPIIAGVGLSTSDHMGTISLVEEPEDPQPPVEFKYTPTYSTTGNVALLPDEEPDDNQKEFIADAFSDLNQQLADTLIRTNESTAASYEALHQAHTSSQNEFKESMLEALGDIKDAVQNQPESVVVQPVQTIVDDEMHDRADAKLERRRNLMNRVRGNDLS